MEDLSRRAVSDFDEEKRRQLSKIISVPMTPSQFRAALDGHPDWVWVGEFYDTLLRRYMKKSDPVKAEIGAMRVVKRWWVKQLSEGERMELEKRFYGEPRYFMINLIRNAPWGAGSNYWQVLENGVMLGHVEPMLTKLMIDPEAIKIIVDQIKEKGGVGYIYEIRIAPTSDNKGFNIAVRRFTLQELKERREKEKKAKALLKDNPSS